METKYLTQDTSFTWYTCDIEGRMENLDVTTDLLEYKITYWDDTTQTEVDVFPGGGLYNTVNLAVDTKGIGIYYFGITIPNTWNIGKYYVNWRETKSGNVREVKKEFEIIQNYVPGIENENHLCLIYDLRQEGIAATVTDARLFQAIIRATEYIQSYTGRIFTTRFETQRTETDLNGVLPLYEPLCCVQQVEEYESENLIDLQDTIPFRRHLVNYFGSPSLGEDDRDHPKIESNSFIKKTKYNVTGVFGYSEWDGSDIGKLPEQIRLAAINMALKYQASLLGSSSGGSIPAVTDRIIEEKTATQSYKLSPLNEEATDMLAGDTELTRLLKRYKRPPIVTIV